jgi:hypothetical protein
MTTAGAEAPSSRRIAGCRFLAIVRVILPRSEQRTPRLSSTCWATATRGRCCDIRRPHSPPPSTAWRKTRYGVPESDGKWTIVQVLQHLADSDLVWGWRLRLILAHDRPAITGYDQGLWAERLHYAAADARQALETFGVLRAANLRLLDRSTPADMARVGVHSERGEESVGCLCRLYAGHDLLHVNQIARIAAGRRP